MLKKLFSSPQTYTALAALAQLAVVLAVHNKASKAKADAILQAGAAVGGAIAGEIQ